RGRREAGHRVELVDEHPPVLGVEEVDAGQPLAAHRLEYVRGHGTQAADGLLGDLRGGGEAAGRQVLRLDGVEVETRGDVDLRGRGHLGYPAVLGRQHAALDLAAVDLGLHEDLRVVFARGVDGGDDGFGVGGVGDPGDADAAAGSGGLDEDPSAELGDVVQD